MSDVPTFKPGDRVWAQHGDHYCEATVVEVAGAGDVIVDFGRDARLPSDVFPVHGGDK